MLERHQARSNLLEDQVHPGPQEESRVSPIDYRAVFDGSQIVVIGENHSSGRSKRFITEALPVLKELGFGAIFLEGTPSGKVFSGSPEDEIIFNPGRQSREGYSSRLEMLRQAHASGVAIRGLDVGENEFKSSNKKVGRYKSALLEQIEEQELLVQMLISFSIGDMQEAMRLRKKSGYLLPWYKIVELTNPDNLRHILEGISTLQQKLDVYNRNRRSLILERRDEEMAREALRYVSETGEKVVLFIGLKHCSLEQGSTAQNIIASQIPTRVVLLTGLPDLRYSGQREKGDFMLNLDNNYMQINLEENTPTPYRSQDLVRYS